MAELRQIGSMVITFATVLVFLPFIALIVGATFIKDSWDVETVFIRALEVSSMLLFTCYILHMTGIATSFWQVIIGAVCWGIGGALGEYSRHLHKSNKV